MAAVVVPTIGLPNLRRSSNSALVGSLNKTDERMSGWAKL